jgi:short-subunit dehydrogenase
MSQVALITGGSSGIGLAFARRWVARGGRAALVARGREKLEAAVRELGESNAAAFPTDVTDRQALAALPDAVVARFGGLHVLVNNAGTNHRGVLTERSAEQLAEILETNLLAPVLLTRAALPHLSSGATIVNVASLAGKIPVPDEATYCSSKAGLRAFSHALRAELAEHGIRVATVCPGPVDTPFFDGELERVPDYVFSQPMSTAEEVADAILHLVDTGAREVDLPWRSGKLATLGYLLPGLYTALRPRLSKLGARNKQRYAELLKSRTSTGQ